MKQAEQSKCAINCLVFKRVTFEKKSVKKIYNDDD